MKIIAGNWKMNGTAESLDIMLTALADIKTNNTVIICPPFTLLAAARNKNIAMGAQDVSMHESGAYTGEISAGMIAAADAKYVIVGHSERRQYHAETNEIVAAKAAAALAHNLTPIICVGETREQKESGKTLEIIEKQIRESIPTASNNIIVAYEPLWAIGTGLVPTVNDIQDVHAHIAKTLDGMGLAHPTKSAISSGHGGTTPILYGGSVKGSNAAEIMAIPNVGGVLVGGASLKPDDFVPIIMAV